MGTFDYQNLKSLMDQVYPRILSQIDHDPHSPTYGSCDRGFWMYRLHDFSSGIIQQSSLFFALLSKLKDFDDSKRMFAIKIASAINNYNIKIAHENGSFDEYYPGEHSYVATAFTSYATLKSAILLGQTEIIQSPKFKRTFEAFMSISPTAAANQDIAYCAFAGLYAKTTGIKIPETEAKIIEFLERKEFNGEFVEYGGVDLGYASVTLNYLSYLDLDGLVDTKSYILKLGQVCSNFVSQKGNFGGEYASRSTSYFLPFGFCYASQIYPSLGAIFARLNLTSVVNKIDDRYLIHYFSSSLAQTLLSIEDKPLLISTVQNSTSWGIEGSSLFYFNSEKQSFYIGLNKGGSFYLEKSTGEIIHDNGLRVQVDGLFYSSSTIHSGNTFTCNETNEQIAIQCESFFSCYKQLIASPLKTIILRLLSFMGYTLNAIFKNLLIKKPVETPGIKFSRTISVNKNTGNITITDKVTGTGTYNFCTAPASSFRLVPSAKFTMENEEKSFLTKTFNTQLPFESVRTL
jgi:hypothetical protein